MPETVVSGANTHGTDPAAAYPQRQHTSAVSTAPVGEAAAATTAAAEATSVTAATEEEATAAVAAHSLTPPAAPRPWRYSTRQVQQKQRIIFT